MRWNIQDFSAPSVYVTFDPNVGSAVNSVPQITGAPVSGSGPGGTSPSDISGLWSCGYDSSVNSSNPCNRCGGRHRCTMTPLTALDEAMYVGDHELYFMLKSTYDCKDGHQQDMILTQGSFNLGTDSPRAVIDPSVFILRLRILPYKEPDCTPGITRHFTGGETIEHRVAWGSLTTPLGAEANGDCKYSHNWTIVAINDPNAPVSEWLTPVEL